MTGPAAFLVACMLGADRADAAARMDVLGGVWRDDFTDLAGLTTRQQVAQVAPTGVTIDGRLQVWAQPSTSTGFAELFTAPGGDIGPTVRVQNSGSLAESLTLRQVRVDPGVGLTIATECGLWRGDPCPGQPPTIVANGIAADSALLNAPYTSSGLLPMAGWGGTTHTYFGFTVTPSVYTTFCCNQPGSTGDSGPASGDSQMIGDFFGLPLLSGAKTSLVPGQGYTVTWLAGALLGQHISHTATPYLMFEIANVTPKIPIAVADATLYEGQFVSNAIPTAAKGVCPLPPPDDPGPAVEQYSQMTPFTLHLPGSANGAKSTWDFKVYSAVPPRTPGTNEGDTHCTVLGPVWVTPDKGTYASPVLDTLSDFTRWVDIGWTLWQSTIYVGSQLEVDSQNSAIPIGSPITPVRLGYAVSNANAATLPASGAVPHGGETVSGFIGMNMVRNFSAPLVDGLSGAPLVGRYFQWSATLYGRGAAPELDPDLAPYPPLVYFGGWRPTIRRIEARYYVCAGQVVSARIAPTSVKHWASVAYVTELPTPGATVRVDVVAADGTVLLADAASGASLAAIDPYRYPVLQLRATFASDPADCEKRPILRAWQVTWEPLHDILDLTCNGVRPDQGETCRMQLRVDRPGHASVEVHDAAGQSVRLLFDADVSAQAAVIAWDGRDGRGQAVAPGVYFVVAKVPGGRQVKRLAVVR